MINDDSAVGLTYNAHAGFGLYVVVGGVLATIGALVWLVTDRRLDAAPERQQPARPLLPGPLLAVGAIVGAVGAFPPWGEAKSSSSIDQVNQGLVASGAAHVSVGGVNQDNGGWLVLGGALLALIAAVTLFDRGRALWAAVVGLLGGLVMAGVGLYDLFVGTKKLNDAMNQLQQQLAATGSTPEQTGLNFEVSLSFGLYLVLVGAVLALSGAVIGLRADRGRRSGLPDAARECLARNALDPPYAARPLRRLVQRARSSTSWPRHCSPGRTGRHADGQWNRFGVRRRCRRADLRPDQEQLRPTVAQGSGRRCLVFDRDLAHHRRRCRHRSRRDRCHDRVAEAKLSRRHWW